MDAIIGKLPDLVNGFSTKILSYALLLAAVATVTMTFLELIKALFKLRLFYHRGRVKRWVSKPECLKQLEILSLGDDKDTSALFDQPTDKLMGQIQAATNVAVDFPTLYPELYSFLTAYIPTTPDGDAWKNFISNPAATMSEPTPESKAATEARARIDHFVTRKLDAFQTQTEYRWARINQYLSVTISALILLVLLTVHLHMLAAPALLLSFAGGMMAPLSKDVVAALSGLRAK